MSQEFGRRNLGGHCRECRNQAGNASNPAKDFASDHENFRALDD